MKILKDLNELTEANVITQETADNIRNYYQSKSSTQSNRLFTIFGIMGAVLIGLGIILIIAHNWDDLSRQVKTVLSFVPLVLGQIACIYTLMKKHNQVAWREGSATFSFFAIGAVISLISQIYHIPGNLGSYLFTWSLLTLPLIYIMRSSMVSLLYLIGITAFAIETGYDSHSSLNNVNIYWLLLAASVPHYYQLYKNSPESNFSLFHHWFFPVSIIISLGTIAKSTEELMFISYFNLFGIFYLIGSSQLFQTLKPRNNSYQKLGSLGSVFMLLMLSFEWFWKDLQDETFIFEQITTSPEMLSAVLSGVLAIVLLYYHFQKQSFITINPQSYLFLAFILTFIIGMNSNFAIILINLFAFGIGIYTILKGISKNHLGITNYGLLILVSLVTCRFFDEKLSFIFRGSLFVIVGIGFFVTNYHLLKKRKSNES